MTRTTPEQARDALKKYPDLAIADYWSAIIAETLPDYYRSQFQRIRAKSTDLPAEDVRLSIGATGNQAPYLCQGTSIVGLSLTLEGAIEDEVITDSSLIERIRTFRQHPFAFHRGEFTTPEEMQMMNRTLIGKIDILPHSVFDRVR
jgi:hypothetical protein